ncbi:molybdenum cofactor guanylyltransferase MobA [Pseudomonas sp. N040]|uniref:molybdenum cofactor guanylyltransferase MobA n=1 Tax=Pseudomonas sp. N040 TaxID=2785325 RepID=UPI0018A29A75|nr:molybdenum cofactor guanylyltransferase MobA [Pseudomonas sp. N040]MBF7731400.1 molybdenum cofactor guanylyltransferase MobA [Pseudomonas sp. N040]MBW7015044.1 molybdenum cofactor guanylyltransferase MobA [Pseudomonas sp. N040]
MPHTPLPPCSILLLAGGRGQRMGGADKGLLEWRGKPLIAWLHEQVRPLSDDLIISCNRNQARYAPYADQLVSDAEGDFPGPLAGIRAGLACARHPYLLVLPCDAPLLDRELLQRLLQAAGERAVLLRQGDQWQPLFSLWPRALRGQLDSAWHAGQRSPLGFLRSSGALTLDCAADDPRLSNLNTPQLLEQAAQDRPQPGKDA